MSLKKNIKAYCDFFENIHKNTSIDKYKLFFDDNSVFQDPFQKVQGVNKIYKVFQDMYETLHSANFKIKDYSANDKQAFIQWKFIYKMKKSSDESSFVGVSIVKFDENSKVISHIDYWDAASNIYEKIPFLGVILKIIRKKISINE
ncbi:hypothetical protein CRV00_06520 [Malaciobacter molluscorum]|uniref:nuclear transport factor 2 family protein n=1 Tax=Malaciobacter molluscorum TaxID=1032072 RepID=UPI00100B093A|nr:nuclear transport factor 2 family protein [Malaciobacter molluscorum]RXJ94576.1 hypothetical protein CRV00_06520 [Malaciobacter molluscorum]